jgi:ribosome maturation factor RimP
LILDLVNFDTIVLEQDGVFGVQSVLQVISVEDTLEFSKEVQRSLDVSDNLEVLVNVLLELSFNGRNINLEVDEISIKSVTG